MLLVMFPVGLLLASGLLYIISLDLAAVYPEVGHPELPIYVAVLVGLTPTIAGISMAMDAAQRGA